MKRKKHDIATPYVASETQALRSSCSDDDPAIIMT